jgi:hypothetical protein
MAQVQRAACDSLRKIFTSLTCFVKKKKEREKRKDRKKKKCPKTEVKVDNFTY